MTTAISTEQISKHFGANHALDQVDFDVTFGEVHALVGENGAGKSTLIRILSGVHQPDTGRILVDGKEQRFAGPYDAIAAGIVTIPQELRLVPALSIAENIALGDLPVRRFGPLKLLDRKRLREQASAVLAQLDFVPDVDCPVSRLPFAERQLVAIGRALHHECSTFILDEPTAALEQHEIERLFSVLMRMRSQGTAIIYISHELDEVVEIADRCTVLRDGRVAATARRGTFAVADLISAMTGRVQDADDSAPGEPGRNLLHMQRGDDQPVSVRAGEIIGLAGLLGSGTEAIMRSLFGVSHSNPVIKVGGEPRALRAPAEAIAAGIGFTPGERALGLVLNQSVRDNILLASLDRVSRKLVVDRTAGDRIVAELMDLLDIRPRRPDLPARALSGGNQQKVILAKWLARRVRVLLLEEPTQGIDVGAKAQIHALIRDFVRRGGGALIASSDLAELARLCDAVLTVRQGAITARLDATHGLDEATLRTAIGA
ncbi:MAG: sugar ABC transporter ATP-binding protein [Xanthobacteraceae bacterium]|nr:sugar ABC transporter ATP-binding protein [Xanthobacteraceae bacterium]